MKWRRIVAFGFAGVALLVVSVLLYLAFGDLGRHKQTVEDFVSKHTGREFVIEGPFELEVFPVIKVLAERVRFANAAWGSKPQMVEVGHLSAEVRFWSLISGPVDIRAFELKDVDVLLEKRRDGDANWIFARPAAGESHEAEIQDDSDAEPKPRTEFPLVIQKARLENVRLTYRAAGKSDQVARLDALTITPGKAGLLGLEGRGKFDDYPIALQGEAGPVASLLAGRDIRMNLVGSLGRLGLDIDGSFGQLDPLDGANLKIKATGEDVGAMLARFDWPVFATGALALDVQLADGGEDTKFDLDARVGDLAARASGSLSGLYLRGSDFRFEATAADAARLAGVFNVDGIPAVPLALSGRLQPTSRQLAFSALKAQLGGVSAQVAGTWKHGRRRELALDFDLGVENLANLRAGLTQEPFTAKGKFFLDKDKVEISGLDVSVGRNPVTGSFMLVRTEPRRIEVELSSPRLDLTPYFAREPEAPAAEPAGASRKKQPAKSTGEKPRFLFGEAPLPILQLTGTEARLHVAAAELTLANKVFHEIDGTLQIDKSQVQLRARARGSLDGAVDTSIVLQPAEGGSANVTLKVNMEDVRAGLDMKDMQPAEVPPLSAHLELTTRGATPRQLAENSNGSILLTQGPGKTRAEFLNAFGGDMISQLRTRLNPFRAQDPFTQLDCTVIRADIVEGAVTVTPVLVQTQKVTVAAKGKLDLHSEQLTFDFDTRPRKGIGVSPGMFTNPFIRVEGTLMSPRIAVGAKGVTSGAVAAATGGLSVIAGGFIDRLKGEANMCQKTLEKAMDTTRSAGN
jgi:uncharacterized protein involved in outer membrane biogenesis